MKKIFSPSKLIAGFATAVLTILAFLWLFRAEVESNPALGLITRKFRWGQPYSLAIDSNRDGVLDAKAILAPEAADFSSGTGEYFEDWDGDGTFELRSRMAAGQAIWVEIMDAKGLSRLLVGQEARDFLLLHPQRFLTARQSGSP